MVPSCNRLTSNLDEPPQELVSKELVSSAGFQGILVESHYHKENINLSYPMAAVDGFEPSVPVGTAP